MEKVEKQKPKMVVGAPYADRKSKEYEIVPPLPNCPRCNGRMTYLQQDISEIRLWCSQCGFNGPEVSDPFAGVV